MNQLLQDLKTYLKPRRTPNLARAYWDIAFMLARKTGHKYEPEDVKNALIQLGYKLLWGHRPNVSEDSLLFRKEPTDVYDTH